MEKAQGFPALFLVNKVRKGFDGFREILVKSQSLPL